MKTEMARLKEDEPTITHQERCGVYVHTYLGHSMDDFACDRFKMATQNWRTAAANPKAELS
ncbi:hypothetical protein BDV98DRAFT_558952 [Pterulicium gracile]|uniref:Uncharacterized protein n=1 Tax=Pterulicium gracile TaxID=1884261 RepID=A0A5C3R060_9AGAR|nr:hypothetical protein BDV98DRAFT_558952 [Pterula gracilis]